MKIKNPKFDISHVRQARMSEIRISKRTLGRAAAFQLFGLDSFGFVSSLVLRISIGVAILASLTPKSLADSPDVNDPSQRIYDQNADSFVLVRYTLKRSGRPHLDGGESELGERSVLRHILDKNTLDVVGVILSDKGEVFTVEKEPAHWEVIDHITIEGRDGESVPARIDRLLINAPGRIVRIEGAMPTGWKPLAFAECGPITPRTKLYTASVGTDEYSRLHVGACGYSRRWAAGGEGRDCLRVAVFSNVAVLCNKEGQPLGVTCAGEINLDPDRPVWRGRDILADPGIPDEQIRRIEERMETEFGRNLYEVRIVRRPDPQEDEEESDSGLPFRLPSRYFPREEGREKTVFALGFEKTRLLIPETLPKELVAGIDTITVTVENQDVPARFGGVLKDYAATVIELQEGELPQTVAFPPEGKIARFEPFWAVYARELAGKDVRTEFTRWIEKEQGYADLWYPVVERTIPEGSWLLDRNGSLVGFYAQARHEYDRLESYLLSKDEDRYSTYGLPRALRSRIRTITSSTVRYGRGYADNVRLIDAVEMAKMLGDLPAHYDPHIKHLDKNEQRRRVWLGVEYTAPDKEMIKQMDLRKPTQDGRIGLMVNRVYEGSPAARMGLAEGDMLLKITTPGTPWPIELIAGEPGEDDDGPDFGETDIPQEFAAIGLQMPRRRPWPSQDNYLTRLLADVGRGTTVKLTYIHGSEPVEKEFTIEQAPRDALSAAKYKSEKLGLTVKDATYEVRAALRLKPDEPAVVVTKVDQGTPAALARINAYELIRTIDGVSVDSVETLEKLIEEAQKAEKKSVRVTVEWMGKTRLADLKFEAKAPPTGILNSLLQGR